MFEGISINETSSLGATDLPGPFNHYRGGGGWLYPS
jgi:hypothetical protein